MNKMETNMEKKETNEDFTSEISLSFFRHGEKEQWDEEKGDIKLELTEGGRKQAMIKGAISKSGEVVALGSKRKRALDTAGIIAAGKRSEITGGETKEELDEKLKKNIKSGELVVENRLDFEIDFDNEYGEHLLEAINGEDFFKFVVEKSDELAEKYNDKDSFTYSRGAAGIAELIKRYLSIASQWNELVVQDKDEEYPKDWEVILGTHQAVTESFLSKFIEKTKGLEDRNKFIEALDNQGFDFVEGFEVRIINKKDGELSAIVKYRKVENGKRIFDLKEEVSPEILEEIINEKN